MNKRIEGLAKDIQELIDQDGTNKEFIEVCITYLRKATYENFPRSKPEVIEALLIFFRETSYEMYEQEGVDLEALYSATQSFEAYNRASQAMGKAFAKVTRALSGDI